MKNTVIILGMLNLAWPVLAAGQSPVPMNEKTPPVLEYLFDAKLSVTGGPARFSPHGPKEGDHVGSGEGTVSGRLNGTIQWSLYENSNKEACTMQFVGEILTEDGARIRFEGQGHAIIPDGKTPSRWKQGGAFRFSTEVERYVWLNSTLAAWQGHFDAETETAELRFYAPGRDTGTGEKI